MSQKIDKPTTHREPPSDEAMRERHWQLSRRNFCKWALGTAAILAASLPQACAPPPEPPPLPSCGPLDDENKKTIAAFCEVVIPGLTNDPKKIPGAADTCTVELFFDPELPAAPLAELIVLLLNSSAQSVGKKKFAELSYEQQIKAVEKSGETFAEFTFAVQLVRLAYYSTETAAFYLGYPGANKGYVDNPDFSFRKAMSKEMTTDGNMP